MRKSLIIIVLSGITIIMLLSILYFYISNKDVYSSYNKINIKDILIQDEEEYLVYFYMKDCYDCRIIEKDFIENTNKLKCNIYVVDLNEWGNVGDAYNWQKHHRDYDKEIGEIDKNGNKVFYTNESESKYIDGNLKDKNNKKISYEIIESDTEYLEKNSNAKLGKIYAMNNTPYIDINIINGEELKIPGVPMLLKVLKNEIKEFYFDYEVLEYFENIS
ncbi:MAG: hypothetical protein ABF289_09430 [Clostridiales bacterium]